MTLCSSNQHKNFNPIIDILMVHFCDITVYLCSVIMEGKVIPLILYSTCTCTLESFSTLLSMEVSLVSVSIKKNVRCLANYKVFFLLGNSLKCFFIALSHDIKYM